MTGPRIGPAMLAALRTLERAGGAMGATVDLVDVVGPSRQYGYRTVHRCIGAGLLVVDPHHAACQGRRGGGAIVLTDAGRAALNDSA